MGDRAPRGSVPPCNSWSVIDRLYVEYCWLKGESTQEIAPKVDRSPQSVAACIGVIQLQREPYLPTRRVA